MDDYQDDIKATLREELSDYDDFGLTKEIDLRELLIMTDKNIKRYESFVDHLWENVIKKYKNNTEYGLLLDKLDDYNPEKFYYLMFNQESFKKMVKSKKKIESMLSEGVTSISYNE